MKNLEQWKCPVFTFQNMRDAVASGFTNSGIYQVKMSDDLTLDILLKNAEKLTQSETLVVVLTGAIATRGTKKGPFFSGLSITEDLDAPCAFISDPTLDYSQNLTLAWYAGNQKIPKLQQYIIQILNSIAHLYKLRLVLVGGSGAGFGILSIIQQLCEGSLALVWNPQTSISKYFPNFVKRYVESAFPKIYSETSKRVPLTRRKTPQFFERILDQTDINHKLYASDVAVQRNRIIYLQNRHDWHLLEHANPYLASLGKWSRLSPTLFLNSSRMTAFAVGDWGEGHAAPTKPLIKSLIELCVDLPPEVLMTSSAGQLVSQFDGVPHYDWVLCHDRQLELKTEIRYDNELELIYAETTVTNPDPDEVYSHAFYLMVDGKRKATDWYTAKNSTEFHIDQREIRKKIRIIAFVKDAIGRVTFKSSPYHLVD